MGILLCSRPASSAPLGVGTSVSLVGFTPVVRLWLYGKDEGNLQI